jgi:hypothetical protein
MCVPAGLNATIDSEHLDRPNRPPDARLDLRPRRIILDYRVGQRANAQPYRATNACGATQHGHPVNRGQRRPMAKIP